MSGPALDFTDPLAEDDGPAASPDGARRPMDFADPLEEEQKHDPVRLAQAEVTGDMGDAGLGALDGLLMNFGGEIGRAGSALGNKLADWTGASEGRPEEQSHDNSVSPVEDALKTKRGRQGNIAGNVAGGMALGMATGGLGPSVGSAANIAKGYLVQGGIGAGQSLVAGLGAREGEDRFDPASMGKDAAIGGAFGVGGRALGTALGKALAARQGAAAANAPVAPAMQVMGRAELPASVGGHAIRPVGQAAPRAAPGAFEALTDSYVPKPSGLELESIAPRTMVDIPNDPAALRAPMSTMPDIPNGRGVVGRGPAAAGPGGTVRMPPPATAVDLPYDMHAPGAQTVPDLQYSQVPQGMPAPQAMPPPGMQSMPTVPNRAAVRQPPNMSAGPAVPELGPPPMVPGVREGQAAATQAAQPESVWKKILPAAVKLFGGGNPIKREGIGLAVRLLQKQAGQAPKMARPSFVPDPSMVQMGSQVGMGVARHPKLVARPDVPTVTWAMQSMNSRGDTGLPPDEQARFNDILTSGDHNKVSAAYMQYSMKYPRFQRLAEQELESINDDGGG